VREGLGVVSGAGVKTTSMAMGLVDTIAEFQ
jgi:hypothetical protein